MFRAKLNLDGSVGFESMPRDYKVRAGEVLFADPPTEQQLDEAFPARKKPAPPVVRDLAAELDALQERIVRLEAKNVSR